MTDTASPSDGMDSSRKNVKKTPSRINKTTIESASRTHTRRQHAKEVAMPHAGHYFAGSGADRPQSP